VLGIADREIWAICCKKSSKKDKKSRKSLPQSYTELLFGIESMICKTQRLQIVSNYAQQGLTLPWRHSEPISGLEKCNFKPKTFQ
jgi:hypothetical protein